MNYYIMAQEDLDSLKLNDRVIISDRVNVIEGVIIKITKSRQFSIMHTQGSDKEYVRRFKADGTQVKDPYTLEKCWFISYKIS